MTESTERWDLAIQRNFPPFALSTSMQVEWKGVSIGPLSWKRGREIAVKFAGEQAAIFMNPAEYYISTIGEVIARVNNEFEKALDDANETIHATVRVLPGSTKEDLARLNELHTRTYGLMVVGYDIAGDIKAALERTVSDMAPLETYLSVAHEETGVTRERDAIQAAKEGRGSVESLAEAFGYLHQDYLGKPWIAEDYAAVLTSPDSVEVPEPPTVDLTRYSDYERWLIQLFKKNLYLYEEARNAMVRSAWAMKETLRALGEDPERLLWMTLSEVTAYAAGDGPMLSDDLLAKRQEAYGGSFHDDTYVEVEGRQAVEAMLRDENLLRYWDQSSSATVTELRGRTAFKGYAKGKARIVFNQEDADLVEEGDILISPMTQVEFLSGIRKCGAIVTDEGGIVCHAAIVAREFGKPCILATKQATKVFKDGDTIEVDATAGIVRILERAA